MKLNWKSAHVSVDAEGRIVFNSAEDEQLRAEGYSPTVIAHKYRAVPAYVQNLGQTEFACSPGTLVVRDGKVVEDKSLQQPEGATIYLPNRQGLGMALGPLHESLVRGTKFGSGSVSVGLEVVAQAQQPPAPDHLHSK